MHSARMLAPAISAIVAAGAMLASACGGGDGSDSGGRLNVVATTVQITAIAERLGGEHIALRGIVPAGADAHEFEPTAKDLAAIEDARLILRHGAGLDDWLDDTLAAGDSARVVTVTDGIALERPALASDGGGMDPHVWQDPERAKMMVRNVARALAGADAANAAAYDRAANEYEAALDAARAEAQRIIDEIPAERRKMVTNHDAFGYFARAFGLEVVGAVIPGASTQAEPSAKDTGALLDVIRAEGVRAIFAESSVDARLARTLASDAGVTIVDDLYGDSLGKPGSGAETIEGMWLANARSIAGALTKGE